MAGAPSERRRYLDVALCQIAPRDRRALSEYKALAQRNVLLSAGGAIDGGDPGNRRPGTQRWPNTERADPPPQPGHSTIWIASQRSGIVT